jgi:hypothetical protein
VSLMHVNPGCDQRRNSTKSRSCAGAEQAKALLDGELRHHPNFSISQDDLVLQANSRKFHIKIPKTVLLLSVLLVPAEQMTVASSGREGCIRYAIYLAGVGGAIGVFIFLYLSATKYQLLESVSVGLQ